MGPNKKQGRRKEEKTRGKQTEPQLMKCVSLAHTQAKGCSQNCLLWSRTSAAFLFLPQNDRELPRRISSTLEALLGPTKKYPKKSNGSQKAAQNVTLGTASATDALSSSTVPPRQPHRLRLKGGKAVANVLRRSIVQTLKSVKGSQRTRASFCLRNKSPKQNKKERRPTEKSQNKAAEGRFPSASNNLQSLLPPSVIEEGLGEDGFSLYLSFSQSQPWHGRPLDGRMLTRCRRRELNHSQTSSAQHWAPSQAVFAANGSFNALLAAAVASTALTQR